MKDTAIVFVGMDVHKESISLCVFHDNERELRQQMTIPNEPGVIRKVFTKLQREGEVRACYEAGCWGYVLYRQLAKMAIACDVVAPSLIPKRAGDRVKTDRRDAEKLARLFRAGELTSIRVPSEAEEALRDLVRSREDVREDVTRERHRLLKFLLRHGRTFHETNHWTQAHWKWLGLQHFENPLAQMVFVEYVSRLQNSLIRLKALDEAIVSMGEKEPYATPVKRLRCLRGIDTLSAVILVAEICDFRRFEHPADMMSFLGLVPSEHSSGGKRQLGRITKTGNANARRVLIEAAWHYRLPARRTLIMQRRWDGQPGAIVEHAWKAQERLHRRYMRLTLRGKPHSLAIVAVARELCGFIWALATSSEQRPCAGTAGRAAGKSTGRVDGASGAVARLN
jgi:transposase